MTAPNTARIRELNDALRACREPIAALIANGSIMLTQALAMRGEPFVSHALAAVAAFDEFSEDNDPWQEHDMAFLHVDRERIFGTACGVHFLSKPHLFVRPQSSFRPGLHVIDAGARSGRQDRPLRGRRRLGLYGCEHDGMLAAAGIEQAAPGAMLQFPHDLRDRQPAGARQCHPRHWGCRTCRPGLARPLQSAAGIYPGEDRPCRAQGANRPAR
jgi:uncharacterized protein DUF3768